MARIKIFNFTLLILGMFVASLRPFFGFFAVAMGVLLFIQSKNAPVFSPLSSGFSDNKAEYRRQLSILYELNTGLSGTSNQEMITNSAVNYIVSRYEPSDYYRGLNNHQIADYSKVFKYSGLFTRDFTLRREPRNEYDTNAIAVYIDELKIGYIPKKDSRNLAPIMDRYDYKTEGVVEITGGPYKEFDHYSDKILTEDNYAYGFKVKAFILNKDLL